MHSPAKPPERGRLAVALVLPLLAALCVGFAAVLLRDTGSSLPRAMAMLRALSGPDTRAARAVHHAIEGAAVVALVCGVLSVPLGWTLEKLPRRWAVLGLAMLWYPALTLVMGWLLCLAVRLQVGDPLQAVLAAAPMLRLPTGPRLALMAIILPPLTQAMIAAWRRPDPAVRRAAETLGASHRRTIIRLVLPDLLPPLIDGAATAFIVAAAILAISARQPAVTAGDGRPLAAVAAAATAALLFVYLIWRISLTRRADIRP